MYKNNKITNQNFNYHTHTYRCGHASDVQDEEYVKSALEAGLRSLGFSDHVPNHQLELSEPTIRMQLSEVDNYLDSIQSLKEKYEGQIEIISGYEAEYDPKKLKFLCELRDNADYMVLGQHFIDGVSMSESKSLSNDPYFPVKYAERVASGIRSGIFDIVVHPDYYMKYRDSFVTEEQRKTFEQASAIANRMICDAAKEYDVPLELNYGRVCKNATLSDGEYQYPHSSFWRVASITGNKVIYGLDAHDPRRLQEMQECISKIRQKIDVDQLNIITDYNPVTARWDNSKLITALDFSRDFAKSYEGEVVKSIICDASLDSNFSSYEFIGRLHEEVEKRRKRLEKRELNSTLNQKNKLVSLPVTSVKRNHIMRAIDNYNDFLCENENFWMMVNGSIDEAFIRGCKTREEFLSMVPTLVGDALSRSKKDTKPKEKAKKPCLNGIE